MDGKTVFFILVLSFIAVFNQTCEKIRNHYEPYELSTIQKSAEIYEGCGNLFSEKNYELNKTILETENKLKGHVLICVIFGYILSLRTKRLKKCAFRICIDQTIRLTEVCVKKLDDFIYSPFEKSIIISFLILFKLVTVFIHIFTVKKTAGSDNNDEAKQPSTARGSDQTGKKRKSSNKNPSNEKDHSKDDSSQPPPDKKKRRSRHNDNPCGPCSIWIILGEKQKEAVFHNMEVTYHPNDKAALFKHYIYPEERSISN